MRALRPTLTESRERVGWNVLSGRGDSGNGRTWPEEAVAATTLPIGSQISWVLSSTGPAGEPWDEPKMN